jgi:hypothetical protein
MRLFILVAASLALAGCTLFHPSVTKAPDTASAEANYQRIEIGAEVATAEQRAACAAAGGEISREGMMGWEHCVQTYPDAGIACSGSEDCIGTCRHTGEQLEPGTEVQGSCQVQDVPFGCYATVEDGKVQHALCVD